LSDWTVKRARVAALTRAVRAGERTQAELDQAIREFKDTRVERYVAKIIEDWPSPSEEQLNRVVTLLRAGSRSGG
jgi:hypothetical protein